MYLYTRDELEYWCHCMTVSWIDTSKIPGGLPPAEKDPRPKYWHSLHYNHVALWILVMKTQLKQRKEPVIMVCKTSNLLASGSAVIAHDRSGHTQTHGPKTIIHPVHPDEMIQRSFSKVCHNQQCLEYM